MLILDARCRYMDKRPTKVTSCCGLGVLNGCASGSQRVGVDAKTPIRFQMQPSAHVRSERERYSGAVRS